MDFHANCNYIVGGSDDRYVRVWDVLSGACVRTFTGHRAPVRCTKVRRKGGGGIEEGIHSVLSMWSIRRICGWRWSNSCMGSIQSEINGRRHKDIPY